MENKIYIGSGKQGKYGIKLSFGPKDIEAIKANLNEKGWINININARKEADKYGNTHYGTLDTWKPDKRDDTQHSPDTADQGPGSW